MSPKYKTEFSKEELRDALYSGESEAKRLIGDRDKWEHFKKKMYGFLDKGKKIPVLGSVIDDVITMTEMADAYVKKEYLDIPFGTILSVVAALIYILNPFDLIPDVVPVVGYVDDVAVVMLVLRFGVDKDLNRFRKWKKEILSGKIELFQNAYSEKVSEFIGDQYLAAAILADTGKLKLLLCENANVSNEIECVIKEMTVPIETLYDLDIKAQIDMISVLEASVVTENIKWVNGEEKKIYLEPDFEDKWDRYIILED